MRPQVLDAARVIRNSVDELSCCWQPICMHVRYPANQEVAAVSDQCIL